MYIKFAIPKIRTMIFPGIFRKKKDEVHYIGGAEVLPPPLAGEDEAVCIEMLTSDESGQLARKQLIEHNLRLVVYIAKKFDNTGVGVEDLISIGTIGLIKAINTFIDEPLNVDWDGNELLLSDILGTDEDVIYHDIETDVEHRLLKTAIGKLSGRERMIIELRFGLNSIDGEEKTQKEVADMLGISQSYISRLEKKIMGRLKKEIVRLE